MKVRRLDDDHDWTFGAGLANYATESEAIKQCVVTILLSWRDNWFLALDHGIDWKSYFVKNPNVKIMESDLRRNVRGVEGIYSLDDLRLTLNTVTRHLVVTVRYTDIYSKTVTVVQNATNY